MTLHHKTLTAVIMLFAILVACSIEDAPPALPPTAILTLTPTQNSPPTNTPTSLSTHKIESQITPTSISVEPAGVVDIPIDSISLERMFGFLENLTAIQPDSGWRNSATEGEAEALDYVFNKLEGLSFLDELGLELERQSFRVYNSTEIWDAQLHLVVDGNSIEVPANGIRGNRDDNYLALRFDSDGKLNDTDLDPVVVDGPAVLIRTYADLQDLGKAGVEGRIVFLDYAAIDRFALDPYEQSLPTAADLLAHRPAGVVLVTQNSNTPGESHGTFVGDSHPFTRLGVSSDAPVVPILYARLEDMAPAGITGWDGFAQIENAQMTWDADVLAPGVSGNLIARIPGIDSSKAMILGAHIDSPNSPGALDDGSGSAILLEVAHVLDRAQIQPPVDLYLLWFGSEELGGYGSTHFAATHQELLDQTLAMLSVDMLSHPLDGIQASISITSRSYGRWGDDRIVWAEYLSEATSQHGVDTLPVSTYDMQSDNLAFISFDVPNANLVYEGARMRQYGPIHYATHVHDPYDTVTLAREMGDVLEQMAQVALVAALETGRGNPDLRVVPQPERRVLFVASHTEPALTSPIGFFDLGQTLAMEGFDVDMIPYGQAVSYEDLQNTDIVVVLPVMDFPGQAGNGTLYDEAWSLEELDAIERYVAEGGLVVLTNSAHRLTFFNTPRELNEDWIDVNRLSERLGIHYKFGTIPDSLFWVEKGSHPLVEGLSYLEICADNGVPISLITEGTVLAWVGNQVVMGLVEAGEAGGQVLALADIGILNGDGGSPKNLKFWQNLGRYARSR